MPRLFMTPSETERIILRGPLPVVANIPSKVWKKAWLESLIRAHIIVPNGNGYLVETQPFYVHSAPVWGKVRDYYVETVAKRPLEPPAQLHSVTSIEAARSMRGKTSTIRERVFHLLCDTPRTDSELALVLEMSENTVRPRRVELVELGLVGPVGTKKGPSGRLATVWGKAGDDGPDIA